MKRQIISGLERQTKKLRPEDLERTLGFSVQSIERNVSNIVNDYTASLDKIAKVQPKDATFANTFGQLSSAEAAAAAASWRCTLPSLVSTSSEVRQASVSAKKVLKNMWIDSYMRSDVHAILMSVAEAKQQEDLDQEDQRLVSKVMLKFKRNGLLLEDSEKQQVISLKKRIGELCASFEQNINEDATTVLLSEAELAGLPSSILNRLDSATSQQLQPVLSVPLKAPTLLPAMKFVRDAQARRKLFVASKSKCLASNGPVLDDILRLKHELALLLQYRSHAHFVLQDKMAKTPETVMDFLQSVASRLADQKLKDSQVLKELKAKHLGQDVSTVSVEPWDIAYLTRLLKEEQYAVDEAAIKEYFPLWHVVNATLSIYSKILQVTFQEDEEAPVWNKEVKKYTVVCKEDNKYMGEFYLDLFPRDGKYGHQCVFPLVPSSGNLKPSVCNIGNLSKPSPGKPALLDFSEVRTFFHEFGHIMHAICSENKHSMFGWSWDAVPWPGGVEGDFLEAPSQMLENWIYDREVLQLLSSHFQTGEPLPDSTLHTLKEIRFLQSGTTYCRQIYMSIFDLVAHSRAPPYPHQWLASQFPQLPLPPASSPGKEYSTVELWGLLERAYSHTQLPADTNPAASFYHLVMGYDAGYYGYLWSEVYSHDMFGVFQEGGGCLEEKLGQHYRETILKPCASLDGSDMLRNFLGREPQAKRFYSALGLDESIQ
mmetsp:Transcript_20751/g.41096  ORF Transcript_20751/g.41096 Transcript_20751/m.41096 type:complete len:712 (+) Transcript_20751:37-2172(+)|eukprot:CAMPEP_0175121716 /NCGR_PEP_ID=MMETSP0087-20121206/1318_1 /TAXON_ID=136419 /ORGANISM="Unknown Unknown, Strain D1" /LENGTH=711 /DNA_ID=CAMNT_0016403279 /DNA_START=37 /DNA_END=2172 /DNA_ORIENTATION=+